MVRFLVLLLLLSCTALSGCVWAGMERFEPVSDLTVTDPETGEAHQKELRTVLVDAQTQQVLADAQVILVLKRISAYLPDFPQGAPKRPKIVVEKFARLAKLHYLNRELYLWPYKAVGTLYESADIFVYKAGYEPVELEPVPGSTELPQRIELARCLPAESRAAVLRLVLATLSKEEWKEYAKAALEKKLSARASQSVGR
jgi:hypothetical protein